MDVILTLFDYSQYRGKEVYGKTLGILGLGDIGKKVARIAKGFDMRVIGINKTKKPVEGVELTDLKTILEISDIIAICPPLTSETENLISDNEFKKMKKGVVVVNCARHQIVNKEALIKAVESGKLFGFGIETEIMKPIEKDDKFLKYPNIIVSPHNAFNTEEAEIKSFDVIIENIKGFLSDKLNNIVT